MLAYTCVSWYFGSREAAQSSRPARLARSPRLRFETLVYGVVALSIIPLFKYGGVEEKEEEKEKEGDNDDDSGVSATNALAGA